MPGAPVGVSASEPDVIFEITRIGAIQRVAAVHVPSGVEVVVQAPANAALADVRGLALRKLQRALEDGGEADGRPGKLV
jgi:hypothetical protein